ICRIKITVTLHCLLNTAVSITDLPYQYQMKISPLNSVEPSTDLLYHYQMISDQVPGM
ncbi:hypothetical protein CDAR_293341, partial [Caerostris darwini]